MQLKSKLEKWGKGHLIKLPRLLSGLTQEDTAALYGVGRMNVSMIESGRFRLRSDLVESIEHAFFISPRFYHFDEPPVFISDVVFFSSVGKLMSRDIYNVVELLSRFIGEYNINEIYLINKNVLVMNVHQQYVFIFSDDYVIDQMILRTKKPDISYKTITLNICVTEQDIERLYNFPFPKKKVFEFIKLFSRQAALEIVFQEKNLCKLIEESRKFITARIRENKINEIMEIMDHYQISFADFKKHEAKNRERKEEN